MEFRHFFTLPPRIKSLFTIRAEMVNRLLILIMAVSLSICTKTNESNPEQISGLHGSFEDANSPAQTFENLTEANFNVENIERDKVTYRQNDAYKLFYGTWEFTSVVSQHLRIGGDEGYESLIGKMVTYSADYFECNGEKFYNPMYLLSIYPLKDDYNDFSRNRQGLRN